MNFLDEDIFKDNELGLDMSEDIGSLLVDKSNLKRKLESNDTKRPKVKKNKFSKISCKDFLDFLDRFCKIVVEQRKIFEDDESENLKQKRIYENVENWYLNQISIFKLKDCEVLYSIFLVIRDINNFVFIEKNSDGGYKILNHEILKRVLKIVFNKNKIETWINSYNSIGVNIVKEDDRLLFK